jgi:PKD repeat protein/photosystem II stability/assembly factor-like uncharacterized protein
MKVLKLILIFLLSTASFAQNNWQERMFEKNENFNSIVDDFNIYKSLHLKEGNKIPKGLGIKQFERWRYYWQGRVDANGNFPRGGNVLNEIEKYKQRQASARYASGTGTWELLGPTPIPNNGTGQLNGSGRLNCITFHPTNPNIIYVGAPAGGFWKSVDNGVTWTEYSFGLTRLGVSSIVIHPTNPDIIYIGTGDRDAGDAPGYGVWRTIDGGLTWSARNAVMGNRTINELLMDPTNSNILIAAASNGRIYRTTDGGANWTASPSLGINPKDIALHPTNSNIVYASGTTVHKSTDGGDTFVQITNGVPGGAQRIALAVSPNQPNWVYLLAGGGSGLIEISRSTDSGTSFVTRTTTPNILGYETNGSGTASQAWYDLVLAADPTDANVIYTGGVNMWKSVNGGSTMSCVSYWVGPSGGVDGVHADQHALEFSPHTNAVYSGNDGGLYVTTDNGANWDDLSNGLVIAQLYKIGVSQTVSDLVINGHQDNGTSISRGTTFSTEIGGDGMECIIDPTNENYMYGALYYGDIRRSTNGGATFTGSISGAITEPGNWVTPYKLDPNNANTMFAGYANIWKNTAVRTGTTWTQISSFGATSTIVDLAIAPSNSNAMYVSRNGTNKFYSSNNALAGSPTWADLTGNLPAVSSPKDIEIDPTDPTHLFIALNNDIYESINSGVSWTDFSGTLPNISLNTIVIDKDSPIKAMYVGMDVGVYYRDNTMADWTPFYTGLTNVEITELEIHYNNMECKSTIYASTYGQGLWKGDLKDPGNVAPKACFVANTTSGCIGNTFVLTDNSDYTPNSWTWSISPVTFIYVNSTNANSQNPEIQFTAVGNYTIQLTAGNANGTDVLSKPSYIQAFGGGIGTSFNDNFESSALCGTAADCATTACALGGLWSNLTNGSQDNIDWRIDEGGTPSAGTGPSADFNPGTATGNYAYLEASGGCNGQTAILESQCVLLDQQYDFIFAYHMYGVNTGSLHVDVFINGGWVEDIIPAVSGDQGNQWLVSTTPLYIYEGQTVKLRIRGITGNGFESDIAIDDLKFIPKCATTTTWNGTVWSNGAPSLTKTVVLSGNYISSGDLSACTLTVTNNSQITFNAGHTLIVDGNVTVDAGSTLSIENNAALRQVNDNATNSGTIIVKRDATAMNRLDYTAWSSPVIGQQLQSFSPNTVSTRFYEYIYTGTTTPTAYQSVDATSNFPTGKGIMIRSDNTYSGPTVFNGQFNGIPTNGVINQSIGIGYNLLGNPFASPLDANIFLTDNPSIGTLYFWTNTTPASGGVYPTNNFAAYTSGAGGVAAFSSGKVPNGTIQTGQGFYIQTSLAANANFSNKQRVNASVSTQFFRNASAQNLLERHRIWLNLNDINTPYNQILLGYIEGATDNVDHGIDGKVLSDSKAMLYNILNDEAYVIQGKSLPFSDDDVVVLGLKIITAGTYNITLDTVDGLFASQDIFIKDKYTNIIHDVKQSAYVFNSQDGIFEDRFEIVYKSGSLSNIDFETDHSVLIFSNESGININASNRIKEIVVFDVLGRTLFESKSIGKKEIIINKLTPNSQALLIKVLFENDLITTKKIIY